jgi:hypothetical protein
MVPLKGATFSIFSNVVFLFGAVLYFAKSFVMYVCPSSCSNLASTARIFAKCCIGDMALVGKPEERRPLGRPRRRWEVNIKMDLRDVGWGA